MGSTLRRVRRAPGGVARRAGRQSRDAFDRTAGEGERRPIVDPGHRHRARLRRRARAGRRCRTASRRRVRRDLRGDQGSAGRPARSRPRGGEPARRLEYRSGHPGTVHGMHGRAGRRRGRGGHRAGCGSGAGVRRRRLVSAHRRGGPGADRQAGRRARKRRGCDRPGRGRRPARAGCSGAGGHPIRTARVVAAARSGTAPPGRGEGRLRASRPLATEDLRRPT